MAHGRWTPLAPEPQQSTPSFVGLVPGHQPVLGVTAALTASRPESRPLPLTCQQQPGLHDNRQAQETHRGRAWGTGSHEWGEEPLGLTGPLLFKAALRRLGARADPPDRRHRESAKWGRGCISNEKTGQKADKQTKVNATETSNPPGTEFETFRNTGPRIGDKRRGQKGEVSKNVVEEETGATKQ